jgi:transposase
MSEGIEELAKRLVVGRKSDGRCVYDEQAKAELVAHCRKPGVSVSRLAREAGVNANQLSRWLREHGERRRAIVAPAQAAFVPMSIEAASSASTPPPICLQARLPNGVVLDLRGCDAMQAAQLIDTLGRLRCSASTKG